jgi:hypothetical protein
MRFMSLLWQTHFCGVLIKCSRFCLPLLSRNLMNFNRGTNAKGHAHIDHLQIKKTTMILPFKIKHDCNFAIYLIKTEQVAKILNSGKT